MNLAGLTLQNALPYLESIEPGDYDTLDTLRSRCVNFAAAKFGKSSSQVADLLSIEAYEPVVNILHETPIDMDNWRRVIQRFKNVLAFIDEDMQTMDLDNIVRSVIPGVKPVAADFEWLLHPSVIEHCMKHYRDGDYRNAVLDAMLVLTEAIRKRTGLKTDGDRLAIEAFKVAAPLLEFTPRGDQTEKDEHEGFLLIMQGAFKGVRNPKAHRLFSDLDARKAAQYLVFISLLVRRVDEAANVQPPHPERV